MSADLLRPPTQLSFPEALRLSQQAPSILRQQSTWSFPWPLSILTTNDSPERWAIYENLFFSCLRTSDDKSAQACLDKLKERFGDNNERVMGMTGVFHEAVAPNNEALAAILKQYEGAIEDMPTNMVVRKRHVALLKSMGRLDGATAALVDLLDASPIDAEAWSELAELYLKQVLYPQAVFSMEEVLVITPNAWNMHARLAEMIYVATLASSGNDLATLKGLTRSMKSFCRSVELCDDYVRGLYGLKLITTKLKDLLEKPAITSLVSRDTADDELGAPSIDVVQRLNEMATAKLAEAVRNHSTNATGWKGFDESEIIAARQILDLDTTIVVR